jgi:hypothetical protein
MNIRSLLNLLFVLCTITDDAQVKSSFIIEGESERCSARVSKRFKGVTKESEEDLFNCVSEGLSTFQTQQNRNVFLLVSH